VQHRCPSGGQALRSVLQLLTVPGHHLDEVPGMPEGLQHRAGIFKPMLIDRIIELAPSPFFVNLTIVFIGRIGFPADVRNQLKTLPGQWLKALKELEDP
jgi:hypothetical protein